jgi:hypothetical protein
MKVTFKIFISDESAMKLTYRKFYGTFKTVLETQEKAEARPWNIVT